MEMENMENNNNLEQNQDVNNDSGNTTEQQPNQPVDNANVTNQDGEGTDNTANQTANLEAWQKDGRYGKMWKNPDDVYNSYTSLEKSFNELSPKYKSLLKTLKDNGFNNVDTLADELKQFADYRNPESRINQLVSYMEKWLNSDIYSQRVLQFFNQIEAEELQRLYPNMSAEQIKKQQELEQKLQRLELEEKQRKQEANLQNDISIIKKGIQDCQAIANEYGFKLTQEVENYLYDYCGKNNIAPEYIEFVFRKLYGKQLLEARDKKIIANQQANQQKLQQAQILGGGSSNQPNNSNMSSKDKFTKGILSFFGNKQ